MSPENAYEETKKKKNRSEKLEAILVTDGLFAYLYAKNKIKGRWPEAEAIIAKSSSSIHYAKEVIGGRFKEAEEFIAKSAQHSFIYARDVVHGRFEEGEDSLANDGFYLQKYAMLLGTLPSKLHNIMVLLSFGDESKDNVRNYFENLEGSPLVEE